MNTVFNFKVCITDTDCVTTVSMDKCEDMDIDVQTSLLKIFTNAQRKIKNILDEESAAVPSKVDSPSTQADGLPDHK